MNAARNNCTFGLISFAAAAAAAVREDDRRATAERTVWGRKNQKLLRPSEKLLLHTLLPLHSLI
jgi:hypothetical protein